MVFNFFLVFKCIDVDLISGKELTANFTFVFFTFSFRKFSVNTVVDNEKLISRNQFVGGPKL